MSFQDWHCSQQTFWWVMLGSEDGSWINANLSLCKPRWQYISVIYDFTSLDSPQFLANYQTNKYINDSRIRFNANFRQFSTLFMVCNIKYSIILYSIILILIKFSLKGCPRWKSWVHYRLWNCPLKNTRGFMGHPV